MDRHIREPWTYTDDVGDMVFTLHGPRPHMPYDDAFGGIWYFAVEKEEMEATVRRIVAAVNATAGIPTEFLEQGGIQDMLRALNGLCAFAYAVVNPSALPEDFRKAMVLLDATGMNRKSASEQRDE